MMVLLVDSIRNINQLVLSHCRQHFKTRVQDNTASDVGQH